jgi:toluene monooxygenase system ferredoxin subunit
MKGETEKPLKVYDVKQEGNLILANIEEELAYEFDDAEEEDDDFFK